MGFEEVKDAYEEATGAWEGADWQHEFKWKGKIEYGEDGYPEMCPGGDRGLELGCDTCVDAKEAADDAEECAADALGEAEGGDWQEAEELAKMAMQAEAQFGDAPTWRPFYDAVVEASEEDEDEEDEEDEEE